MPNDMSCHIKGKKMAWQAWKSYPNVTEAFTFMAMNPHTQLDIDASHYKLLERYAVDLDDKKSHLTMLMKHGNRCFARRITR